MHCLRFLAAFCLGGGWFVVARKLYRSEGNLLNLNFQLPLRYQEFARLHSVKYEHGRVVVYLHAYSPIQKSKANTQESADIAESEVDESEIDGSEVNESSQHFSVFVSTIPEGQAQSMENELICPPVITNRYEVTTENWNEVENLDQKVSSDLIIQPRLYCLEISNHKNFSFVGTFEIKLDIIIRVPASSKYLRANSHASPPTYCHTNTFTMTHGFSGLQQINGIGFVNGYFHEGQDVRLADIQLADSLVWRQKPEQYLKGTVNVRNYCFEKKIIAYYIIFDGLITTKGTTEAKWKHSPNTAVDVFEFDLLLPVKKLVDGKEIKCIIQRIEYTYHPPGHSYPITKIDNNNGVGYKMVLNSPFEKLLEDHKEKYIISVFSKQAYKYYVHNLVSCESLGKCKPEMLILLQSRPVSTADGDERSYKPCLKKVNDGNAPNIPIELTVSNSEKGCNESDMQNGVRDPSESSAVVVIDELNETNEFDKPSKRANFSAVNQYLIF